MQSTKVVALAVAVVLTCGVAVAQTDWWVPLTRPDLRAPAKYRIVPLGTVGGGISEASGINDAGDVVGWSTDVQGMQRAFLYTDGRMTALPIPTINRGSATRINGAGVITGYHSLGPHPAGGPCQWSNGTFAFITGVTVVSDLSDDGFMVGMNRDEVTLVNRAYVRTPDGTLSLIPTLGGRDNHANAINASHQVVGGSEIGPGARHAFLWQGGAPTDLTPTFPVPAQESVAVAINGQGVVALNVVLANGVIRAYTWTAGTLRDLGPFGDIHVSALDINDKGVVVGGGFYSSGEGRAFVYSAGKFRDLNALVPQNSGWQLQHATGINNKGMICGNGIYGGMALAFRLDPI